MSPLQVLSMSANGDLIIPYEEEVQQACPFELNNDALGTFRTFRMQFPRSTTLANPGPTPGQPPGQPPVPQTPMATPGPTPGAAGSAAVQKGTVADNHEAVETVYGNTIVKRVAMPGTSSGLNTNTAACFCHFKKSPSGMFSSLLSFGFSSQS